MDNYSQYFKSKDIKVFPSSFRGDYLIDAAGQNPSIVFDPESRLNTEANFILPKTVLGKDSYIIKYLTEDPGTLKFMLGGYYFELYNVKDYIEQLTNTSVGITLREVTLHDPGEIIDATFRADSTRTTKILDSWEEATDNALDIQVEDGENKIYYFTGLKILSVGEMTSSASIKLFISDPDNPSESLINQEALLPYISHGIGENSLISGEGLIAAGKNQIVVGQFNKNDPINLFEVGVGSNSADATRKNAFEVAPAQTTINTNTAIKGNTAITGALNISKKATSAETLREDSRQTLTTKSYVDDRFDALDYNLGETGSYIKTVTQTDGQLSATTQQFSQEIPEIIFGATNPNTVTHDNVPSDRTVWNFVKNEIERLDVSEIGGTDTFIQKISEVDGKIVATPKSFRNDFFNDGEVLAAAKTDTTNAPTARATYDYVEHVKTTLDTELTNKINTAKTEAINNTTTEIQKLVTTNDNAAAGNGKYLQTTTQKDGQVKTTTFSFATSIDSTATSHYKVNAPTCEAVQKHVVAKLQKLWTASSITHPTSKQDTTLKQILLDMCYPVGTIYTCYSTSAISTCPIATNLGGEWTAISAGQFLCSAQTDPAKAYYSGVKGGFKDTQLKAHSHNLTKTDTETGTTNNYTIISESGGTHNHKLELKARAHDKNTDTGLRSGNPDGGCHQWTFTYWTHDAGAHTHNLNLNKIKTTSTGTDISAIKDTNLPPYIAVYMWRRTK